MWENVVEEEKTTDKQSATWIKEPKRTWAEWAAIRVLKVGPIPEHVAFIMDGNRRYARQLHKDTLYGHSEGFRKFTDVLSWCHDLNITEVTVYAFSIENFKRTKVEVDGLMGLLEEKFKQLLEEIERLREHGVRIRIIGRIDLLTAQVKQLVAKAVLMTKDNNRCCLNLALAYTSREEMTTSVIELKRAVEEKRLCPNDLSEELLEKCLYTAETSNPDLLIRTSGEVRLSDFLLWQSSLTHLFFTKVLWPQISLWHLLAAVFHYQRHHHTLVHVRREEKSRRIRKEEEVDLETWTSQGQEGSFERFVRLKKERVKAFLSYLEEKNIKNLVQLSQP